MPKKQVSNNVIKGPWDTPDWDDISHDEKMLRRFRTFLSSAKKKNKEAVYVLLAHYIVTGIDLENALAKVRKE